jgi:hypothetical protein
MTFDSLGDPSLALGLTERIAAVGSALASAELLARPRALGEDGLLSWQVARLRSATLAVGRPARILDRIFASPGVQVLALTRLLAAVLVMATPTGSAVSAAGLALCAAMTALLMLRTPYGNDGADQMLLLVLVSCALARLIGSHAAIEYALWFIGLQCLLSYLTSGVAKLAGRSWRDGTGLLGVLNTKTYGGRRLAAVLAGRRGLAVALSWTVILTEALFVLVLVVPDQGIALMLAGGVAFHVGTAVVMGLNAFVWAFGATYPAIAYLAG